MLEALDGLKAAGTGRAVDVLELQELSGPSSESLFAAAPARRCAKPCKGIGALIKAQDRRIFTGEEDSACIGLRVDRLAGGPWLWARRSGYGWPSAAQDGAIYRREEELPAILPLVLRFVGVDRGLLSLERPVMVPPPPPRRPPPSSPLRSRSTWPRSSRGILTILLRPPGCRLELIAGQDYSVLFWFQQKIFTHAAPRGGLPSWESLGDLLGAVSHVAGGRGAVLHEIVAQMLHR